MRVLMIVAQSIDGFITKHDTPGTHFTSASDQKHLRQFLASCDASIMGATTFRLHQEAIASRSPNRLRVIWTRNPANYSHLEKPGSLEFSDLEPQELCAHLAARGIRRVALLGGSSVYDDFIKQDLVDELWLTLEPHVFGKGIPLLRGHSDRSFHLAGYRKLGGDTLLVHYSREPIESWRQRFRNIGYGLAITLALCAAGGLLGAITFPLFGLVFLQQADLTALALMGARKLSFITLIWAPGAAVILTVMKRYRESQEKKES